MVVPSPTSHTAHQGVPGGGVSLRRQNETRSHHGMGPGTPACGLQLRPICGNVSPKGLPIRATLHAGTRDHVRAGDRCVPPAMRGVYWATAPVLIGDACCFGDPSGRPAINTRGDLVRPSPLTVSVKGWRHPPRVGPRTRGRTGRPGARNCVPSSGCGPLGELRPNYMPRMAPVSCRPFVIVGAKWC